MAVNDISVLKRLIAVFLLFLAMCPVSFGWGHEGHQIIATVAEDHLDQTTLVMIQSLLGEELPSQPHSLRLATMHLWNGAESLPLAVPRRGLHTPCCPSTWYNALRGYP
jgi:hypothetical protein